MVSYNRSTVSEITNTIFDNHITSMDELSRLSSANNSSWVEVLGNPGVYNHLNSLMSLMRTTDLDGITLLRIENSIRNGNFVSFNDLLWFATDSCPSWLNTIRNNSSHLSTLISELSLIRIDHPDYKPSEYSNYMNPENAITVNSKLESLSSSTLMSTDSTSNSREESSGSSTNSNSTLNNSWDTTTSNSTNNDSVLNNSRETTTSDSANSDSTRNNSWDTTSSNSTNNDSVLNSSRETISGDSTTSDSTLHSSWETTPSNSTTNDSITNRSWGTTNSSSTTTNSTTNQNNSESRTEPESSTERRLDSDLVGTTE